MIPGKYNITIYRGGSFREQVTPDNDLTVYDEIRLRMYTPWEGVVDKTVAPTPILELTMTGGDITLVDGDTALLITIGSDVTGLLDFEAGQYTLELITSGTPDVVDPLLYGSVTVINGVPTWRT